MRTKLLANSIQAGGQLGRIYTCGRAAAAADCRAAAADSASGATHPSHVQVALQIGRVTSESTLLKHDRVC
jgi:hypothetical protein